MNYIIFDFIKFVFLTLAFILMTSIGTVTHELGHYSVAKSLGYKSSINYKSSSYWDNDLNKYLKETKDKYSNEIKIDIEFPGKEKYLFAFWLDRWSVGLLFMDH